MRSHECTGASSAAAVSRPPLLLAVWGLCLGSSLPLAGATPWVSQGSAIAAVPPAPSTFGFDRGQLMPWDPSWHHSWPVLVCPVLVWILWWTGLILAVIFGRDSNRRFGTFYRAYVSAYLSEAWFIAVWMMPALGLLVFLCCVYRHPIHTPEGIPLHWNVLALLFAGLGCVGLCGVGIVTTREATFYSAYPLQSNVVHSAFTWLACIGLFVYMVFHTAVTMYDTVHSDITGVLPRLTVIVELALVVSTGLHFTLWLIEIRSWGCNERDPRCNQVFEWWCILSFLSYLLTLPILVLCVDSPILIVHAFGLAGVIGLGIGCVWLLCFSHVLSAIAARENHAYVNGNTELMEAQNIHPHPPGLTIIA